MTTPALSDLVTPYTTDQIRAQIYAAIAAMGVSTTSWKPGAVTRTIITCVAIVLAAFSSLVALIAAGGFLDLAVGPWLSLVAIYVYNTPRDPGSFASGVITLTNNLGGTFSSVQIGDLVVSDSVTGKIYKNTEIFSMGSGDPTKDVAIEAVEIGSASSAPPGEIDTMVSAMSGVTCANALAFLATDEEEDPPLRTRCRQKTGTLSPNGPHDAYSYVARGATRIADGTNIGITRVKTIPDGLGGVDCYIANAAGTCTGSEGDPTTDLGRVHQLLFTQTEPLAVTVTTHAATPLAIAVTYEWWLRKTSLTDAQVKTKAATALATYFSGAPIGGETIDDGATFAIYVRAIEAAISGAFPGSTIDLVVSLPAADVSVADTEAPILGSVSATVHQITEVTS